MKHATRQALRQVLIVTPQPPTMPRILSRMIDRAAESISDGAVAVPRTAIVRLRVLTSEQLGKRYPSFRLPACRNAAALAFDIGRSRGGGERLVLLVSTAAAASACRLRWNGTLLVFARRSGKFCRAAITPADGTHGAQLRRYSSQ